MPRGDNNQDGPKLNLAGTVPPDPANGLLAILDELRDHPGKVHVGIVFVDAQHVKAVTDTGAQIPTVRNRQYEFPTSPEDIEVLTKMADRLQGQRTGQPTLASG